MKQGPFLVGYPPASLPARDVAPIQVALGEGKLHRDPLAQPLQVPHQPRQALPARPAHEVQ